MHQTYQIMKKYFFASLLLLVMSSCAAKRTPVHITPQIPGNLELSKSFTTFWSALYQEVKDKDLSTFKPSKALQYRYGMKKLKGGYYISGFITTLPTFKKKPLEDIGIQIEDFSLSSYQFACPLYLIPTLLKTPSVTGLELTQQTFIKQ